MKIKMENECNVKGLRPETAKSFRRVYDLIDKIKDTFQTQEGIIPDTLQNTLDSDLNDIIGSCKRLMENSKKAAGRYLHDLSDTKPDNNDVKKVIRMFPDALLQENGEGEIPIQKNIRIVTGIRYTSLLAEEASRREIGPERGGLLLPITTSPDYNVLQWLVISLYGGDPTTYENDCLQSLKDLRNANLVHDTDFNQFNLIKYASRKESIRRLDYLVNVYPASLSKPLPSGDYSIHLNNYWRREHVGVFSKLLEAGMEHYPESFGFLFRRNGKGRRAINQAIDQYGKKETLKIIQRHIPAANDHPILHHVFRYTPRLAEDFVYMYPNAVALKDRRGRYLLHVAVKRGLKMSSYLLMMIHCDKQCLEEKDPVTNLYPFMLAATSGSKKDLTTIYNLLCYRPDMISRCLEPGRKEVKYGADCSASD